MKMNVVFNLDSAEELIELGNALKNQELATEIKEKTRELERINNLIAEANERASKIGISALDEGAKKSLDETDAPTPVEEVVELRDETFQVPSVIAETLPQDIERIEGESRIGADTEAHPAPEALNREPGE